MKPQYIIFSLLILASVLFLFPIDQAKAATAGPNNPGTNIEDSSVGTVSWSHLDNDQTSDDKYATSQGNMNDGEATVYLKATNFGFSIPTGATINGISVNIERKAGDTGFFDNAIRIVKGGTIGTTDKSSAGVWPDNDDTAAYGGTSDLWGETWADTDINSADFGFAISAKKVGGIKNEKPSIDWINITVTYTPPSGGGVRPTTVIFSGKAFPDATILVVDKDVKYEKIISQNIVTNEDGTFQINFIGIFQSQHSFGLVIKDKENRSTQTKFFNIDTLANDLVL